MKYLPRSNEALAEAAYHVIFSPWANLKGRQQLHGKYEWNKKKKSGIVIVFLVYSVVCFSSRLLLWLGSSCRWGWTKNKFPDLNWNFSVLRGFCPRMPSVHTNPSATAHCPLWAAAAGLCTSWDFSLLVVWHAKSPFTGLGSQGVSDMPRCRSLPRNAQSTWGSFDY